MPKLKAMKANSVFVSACAISTIFSWHIETHSQEGDRYRGEHYTACMMRVSWFIPRGGVVSSRSGRDPDERIHPLLRVSLYKTDTPCENGADLRLQVLIYFRDV